MKEYIVDACIFTGFVAGESSAPIFASYLDLAFGGEIQLLATTVNLGEFYYSASRYAPESKVKEFIEDLEKFNLIIFNPTYQDCIEAAQIKVKGGVSYFDCFNLVLAKKHPKATILTIDSEYKRFIKDYKIKFL